MPVFCKGINPRPRRIIGLEGGNLRGARGAKAAEVNHLCSVAIHDRTMFTQPKGQVIILVVHENRTIKPADLLKEGGAAKNGGTGKNRHFRVALR